MESSSSDLGIPQQPQLVNDESELTNVEHEVEKFRNEVFTSFSKGTPEWPIATKRQVCEFATAVLLLCWMFGNFLLMIS